MNEEKFLKKNSKLLNSLENTNSDFFLFNPDFNHEKFTSFLENVLAFSRKEDNQQSQFILKVLKKLKGSKKINNISSDSIIVNQLQLIKSIKDSGSEKEQFLLEKLIWLAQNAYFNSNYLAVSEELSNTFQEASTIKDTELSVPNESEENSPSTDITEDISTPNYSNTMLTNHFLSSNFENIYNLLNEYLRVNNLSIEEIKKLERLLAHNNQLVAKNSTYNHYMGPITFTDNKVLLYNKEVLNIPESLYLRERQIIEVDDEHCFVRSFNYCSNSPINKKYIALAGNSAYINKNTSISISNFVFRRNIPIDKPLIAFIDEQNRFLAIEEKLNFDIKAFLPHMCMKGHVPYLFLEELSNGILAKNLITNEKLMLDLNLSGYNLSFESTIILKNDEIIKAFASRLVYKRSSFNEERILAIVTDIHDNKVFAETLQGDLFTVRFIDAYSPSFEVGDSIYTDDDFNFLYKLDFEEINSNEKIIRKSKAAKEGKKNKSFLTHSDEALNSVLIIGNISYENNYKLGLRKFGFTTEVIEGYESEYKIKNAASKHDTIVVITNFISHNNMFVIKNNFPNKKVIYAEKDGVSFIGNLLIS